MPWLEVTEPFAKPPRGPTAAPGAVWSGAIEPDRGWAELIDVEIGSEALDLTNCERFSIRDSTLTGTTLLTGGALELDIHRSEIDGCDLSGHRITSVRSSRVTSSKLIGTDLSGSVLADVRFDRCAFRYNSLRMAKLSRVEFKDCSIDEMDAYQLSAEDVGFPASVLTAVNLDDLSAERVDFREAKELSFTVVNRLSGCLIGEEQLMAVSHALAFAAGLSIERLSS